MKRIQIIKNGIVTNQAELPEPAASEWLARHEGMKTFGTPKHTIRVEVKPAVLDEEGEELEAAEYEQQEVPGDYEVVIEDLTEEIEAQEKAEKARLERIETLKDRAKKIELKGTTIAQLRSELNEKLAEIAELLLEAR
jgi:hypothetical protein